jgi:hypothetical protein
MTPKLQYKTVATRFLSMDGQPVQTKGADFVMPSDAEIRKRAKALELAAKRSQPIGIVSFEVE